MASVTTKPWCVCAAQAAANDRLTPDQTQAILDAAEAAGLPLLYDEVDQRILWPGSSEYQAWTQEAPQEAQEDEEVGEPLVHLCGGGGYARCWLPGYILVHARLVIHSPYLVHFWSTYTPSRGVSPLQCRRECVVCVSKFAQEEEAGLWVLCCLHDQPCGCCEYTSP